MVVVIYPLLEGVDWWCFYDVLRQGVCWRLFERRRTSWSRVYSVSCTASDYVLLYVVILQKLCIIEMHERYRRQQRWRQWGGAGGPGPLNKIWPPSQMGLARHNKRFTIKEIIKIVATRCQILSPKCTKSFVGWGFAADPAGEAYSAPSDPLAGF